MLFSRKIKKTISIVRGIGKPKIFCISFQRTGTTSTGEFFRRNGYSVAGYSQSRKNDWTLKWFSGNFEAIFNSLDFKTTQVFEDDPWWCLDFYKFLFHRFPTSTFVLMERDGDNWFDSMVSHSHGKSLGNAYRHSRIYRREKEFYDGYYNGNKYSREVDNLMPLNESYRQHYKDIYELRNREVKEFFDSFGKERLYIGKLEDDEKWVKMGDFFDIKVDRHFDVHVNKSSKK